jgi:hypothetical protein
MAKRLSTAMVDFLSQDGSISGALKNGRLVFFSGTQPASADTASGVAIASALCTFTASSGVYTAETRATFLITVSGTLPGTLDTLTVGGVPIISGAVSLATDVTTAAAAIASNINAYQNVGDFKATSNVGVVTITAPKNTGALHNGVTVAHTETTTTVTTNGGSSATVGGTGATAGVTALNGLTFTFPNASAGVLIKATTPWTGVATATGTAGWFRFAGDGTDVNTTSTTAIRFDGSIGTSGADLIVSSTTITASATQTINTFTINTLQTQ